MCLRTDNAGAPALSCDLADVSVKALKSSGAIAEEKLNDKTQTLRNADGKRNEKRVESDAERKERWRKQAVFFYFKGKKYIFSLESTLSSVLFACK